MPDTSPSEPNSYLGMYRAGLTSPEHRHYITVARKHIVDDTIETLRTNSKKRSKHHYLFIGPRGIGKTHLLSLIEDYVRSDQDLSAAYVVARFPEESNRTLSFADFLLGLVEILKDEIPDETVWKQLYSQIETQESNDIIVDSVVPVLRKENRDRKRTVLIMLENVNEIFGSQIRSKTDIGALRKFLMDANGCLLIATAPIHFDAVTDVGQPFYDFFDTQVLDSLTEEETIGLIRRNLEWDKRQELLDDFDSMRPRLQALYRMTGGSPRLIVMLYELIAHESVTEIQQQFRVLLDRITPFYQDRLRDLSPQERALLETMATMRDQEKTPASISERMRMSPQQTSSILKRLLKSHYLRSAKHPDDKRSRLYTIREGFFDIWLAMNLSRGARKRLPFLLEFFTLFYPSYEAREKKRAELSERVMNDDDPNAAVAIDYLTAVGTKEERALAKMKAAQLFANKGDAASTTQYVREARSFNLDPVGEWIVRHQEREQYTDYLTDLREMIDCWEQHRTGNLESFAAKLVEMGDGLNYKTWSEARLPFLIDHLGNLTDPQQRILLRLTIGNLLLDLEKWKEAETQLSIALDEAEQAGDDRLIALTLNNLAQLFQDTNRLAAAEKMMRRALKIDPHAR